MKKTAVFDMGMNAGLRDLDTLKNRRDVRILESKEYFGIGGSEEGPVTFLHRVVDYEEQTPNVMLDDSVYQMPLC
ncbi:MAG: hypothetical protein WC869_00955 [Phycisphaerae bacterium]|jgi:hypothetical protein